MPHTQPRTCCWIHSPASTLDNTYIPPVYCGRKTSFTIVKDDDGNKVRDYKRFCTEHQAIIDSHPEYSEENEE
jgi:hypothetical protein